MIKEKLVALFFNLRRFLLERWKELLTVIFAQTVFALTAGVYISLFWAHEPKVSFVRYLGAGVTMWAGLSGAYYFVVTQAHWVQGWFRGLAMFILGLNLLTCQILMASHSSVFIHALVIHFVLTMYVVWGLIGKMYYQKRSRKWFTIYKELMSHDVQYWFVYLLIAYVPFLQQKYFPELLQGVSITSEGIKTFSDSTTLFVLCTELMSFMFFSIKHGMANAQDQNGVLDVSEGYRRWAQRYDQGNAVIAAEREHTVARLNKMDISGKVIVDFGCGTGYYTKKLLELGASSMIAIDANEAMLAECKKKIQHRHSVKAQIGGVAALSTLSPESIDGIFCTLVIDHLPEHELKNFVQLGYKALKPGGWIYITDVNPYYETLEHCYARFIDEKGIEERIRVYPHRISDTLNMFSETGFTNIKIEESNLSQSIANQWEELGSLNEFPLILAYSARR